MEIIFQNRFPAERTAAEVNGGIVTGAMQVIDFSFRPERYIFERIFEGQVYRTVQLCRFDLNTALIGCECVEIFQRKIPEDSRGRRVVHGSRRNRSGDRFVECERAVAPVLLEHFYRDIADVKTVFLCINVKICGCRYIFEIQFPEPVFGG